MFNLNFTPAKFDKIKCGTMATKEERTELVVPQEGALKKVRKH